MNNGTRCARTEPRSQPGRELIGREWCTRTSEEFLSRIANLAPKRSCEEVGRYDPNSEQNPTRAVTVRRKVRSGSCVAPLWRAHPAGPAMLNRSFPPWPGRPCNDSSSARLPGSDRRGRRHPRTTVAAHPDRRTRTRWCSPARPGARRPSAGPGVSAPRLPRRRPPAGRRRRPADRPLAPRRNHRRPAAAHGPLFAHHRPRRHPGDGKDRPHLAPVARRAGFRSGGRGPAGGGPAGAAARLPAAADRRGAGLSGVDRGGRNPAREAADGLACSPRWSAPGSTPAAPSPAGARTPTIQRRSMSWPRPRCFPRPPSPVSSASR